MKTRNENTQTDPAITVTSSGANTSDRFEDVLMAPAPPAAEVTVGDDIGSPPVSGRPQWEIAIEQFAAAEAKRKLELSKLVEAREHLAKELGKIDEILSLAAGGTAQATPLRVSPSGKQNGKLTVRRQILAVLKDGKEMSMPDIKKAIEERFGKKPSNAEKYRDELIKEKKIKKEQSNEFPYDRYRSA